MISPPLDVEAAGRVGKHVRLLDVLCLGIEGKQVGVFTPDEGGTLSWEIQDWSVFWRLEDGELQVFVPFELHVHVEGERDHPKKRHLALFRTMVRVQYEAPTEAAFEESDVPHFAGISGLMHAWPYVRSDIQWLTTKLGLPPLTLPVILSGHAAKEVSVFPVDEAPGQLPEKKTKKRSPKKASGKTRSTTRQRKR